MFIKFETPVWIAGRTVKVLALEVFNNGCFSAVVKLDNGFRNLCIYNEKGEKKLELVGLNDDDLGSSAALLDDGYVVVVYDHHVDGGQVQIDAISYDQKHSYTGRADKMKLFANNWYVLSKYGDNLLFNNMHQLQQSGFNNAEMFNCGYALQPKKSASPNEWALFTLDGKFVKSYDNVVDFVGDGNLLLATGEKEMELRNFNGKPLLKKSVTCYEKFADGTFVLTTTDGLSRMYQANGKSLSVEVENATFLAGGAFVHYEGKLVDGVYGPEGILDKREIYSFEKAGLYYLFNDEFDHGVLYDAHSTEPIEKNFVLLKSAGQFALFEQLETGMIVLMNGNGQVFKMYRGA